jgi:tRNA pseudouridine55 synthase
MEQLHALVAQAEAEGIEPRLLLDPLLLPMDSPCEDFPEVNLLPVVAGYVKQGQPVQASGAPLSGLVRMTEGEERKFIGVGEIDDQGRVAPKRLVVEYPE